MKKTKGIGKEDKHTIQQPQQKLPPSDEIETDDGVEVNDPGDCIGHWEECEECDMCEIQDSCKAMTISINGGDKDAE